MQAQDRRLMDLIQGTRQYRVPICQRPYEWDEKRWTMLWNDLIKTMSRRQAQQHLPQDQKYRHFFASIVIRELGGIPVTIIDLIDGQQRLTTFMLLIKALIDECGESNLSDATQSRLRELIMNPGYVCNGEDDTKVAPGARDRDVFFSVMGLRPEGPLIGGRIRDAHVFLRRKARQWLQEIPETERESQVLAVLDAIQMGFAVALVTLDDRDDYYEVFESLNGKHLELAESDKVRNFCFMMLSALGTEANLTFYRNEWLPMEARITAPTKPATLPEEFDSFLHYWTIMESGTQFGIDRLYHTIAERLQARTQENDVVWGRSVPCANLTLSFFREVVQYSLAYQIIRWPEIVLTGGETAVAVALSRLTGDLNMRTSAHPLLLALLGKYLRSNQRDITGLLHCLQILESYLIRRIICDVATNQHNRIAMQLGNYIYTHYDSTLQECAEWMRDQLCARQADDRWPDDIEFERKFAEADFERQGAKRKFAKALLLEIDRRRPGAAAIDADDLTVEHIMPEELTDDWRMHLGQNADIIHRDNLHRFGNLTLLEPRLNRGGDLFRVKKVNYAGSRLILTRELGNLGDEWNADQILQRGHDLFQLMREAWPRPQL